MGSAQVIACGTRANGHASLQVKVPSALPMEMRARIREIIKVETDPEHRGKGHAKALLERVCIAADLSDTWLLLHVEPGDDETTMQGLVKLYTRFGFVPFQASPMLMIRRSGVAGSA